MNHEHNSTDAIVVQDLSGMDESSIESVWEKFWEPLNGSDIEAIKKELFDFYHVIRNVGEVYSHITGGRISKANTLAKDVIGEADAHYERIWEEEDMTPWHIEQREMMGGVYAQDENS